MAVHAVPDLMGSWSEGNTGGWGGSSALPALTFVEGRAHIPMGSDCRPATATLSRCLSLPPVAGGCEEVG